MKRILATILALVMVLALVACGQKEQTPENPDSQGNNDATPTEVYKLKIQVAESENDPKAQYTKKFADMVREDTNGGVDIEVYYNSELGSLSDVLEQISSGANIMVSTAIDQLGSYYYDFNGPAIFYSLPTREAIANFAESDLFAEMCENCEAESNIKILNLAWSGVPRVIMSTKPIENYEDLHNVKIRGASSAYVNFFENCGCSTEVIAWNELYSAMSQGLIDACEGNYSLLYTSSLNEVAKYITESDHYICPAGIFMNSDVYNALPAEYQTILVEDSIKCGQEFGEYSVSSNVEYKAKLEEAGVTILPWSEEDTAKMKEAGLKCWDNYPGLSEGLYERIQDAIQG